MISELAGRAGDGVAVGVIGLIDNKEVCMTQGRLSHVERRAALRRMAAEGVDVLVIGGGITGAGVALEAVARGYRIGLVEKADFASGTSSKSTKLVHGGIRYLPQFDFALVREALIERGRLVRNAPHLVRPLGFVLPLYAENKRPLGTPIVLPGGIGMSGLLRSGLILYDVMAGRLAIAGHKHIGAQKTLELAPALKAEGLRDGFIYYDGQTDDTRLTLTVLRTAAKRGALLANYAEVLGFDFDAPANPSAIRAARVRDALTGEAWVIPAKTIINAAGAFAGRIAAMAGESRIAIRPAKGVHLTLPREVLPTTEYAVVLPETPDGRLLFIVPWNTRVTLGTTDTPGGDLDRPVATDADIDYLINTANAYLRTKLTRAHVISAWAGYRPLISPAGSDGADTAKLSRTHVVVDGPGNMITITGGKLTTYRRMAQDALDSLARREGKPVAHPTEEMPLDGAEGYRACRAALSEAAGRFGWGADVINRLSQYGSEAGVILQWCAEDPSLAARVASDLPYIMAEVVYACRREMAVTLDDVLSRRLHLNFEDWSRGIEPAPMVAQMMAHELGWSSREIEAQVARYRDRLAEGM
ncbi:MAG: glycerol-3-phosphate dehydrogenase/oxidase [Chloroflexi bacterium]|uniref:Glycerol-3-phosphate dehydrogenase/oxidase n=1 Tax=Candidatus Thermofonsia Clade 3 bacterium TaxID=2364212 RepID=A0A2M8QD07_9CHLR|nr:MAG: glycerol-3-phosphate dehydrogenase/oxidase [Candidatus Thermofonsia Clade 3 bacterium]RMG66013.1 MAG: glycerol-3-phosphate dehydrogenase/oxidase [Chloroflexota bacterium]